MTSDLARYWLLCVVALSYAIPRTEDSHAMPELNPENGPDHDVIPAPKINWKLVGLYALGHTSFGLVVYGHTMSAIALCAFVAVVVLAYR